MARCLHSAHTRRRLGCAWLVLLAWACAGAPAQAQGQPVEPMQQHSVASGPAATPAKLSVEEHLRAFGAILASASGGVPSSALEHYSAIVEQDLGNTALAVGEVMRHAKDIQVRTVMLQILAESGPAQPLLADHVARQFASGEPQAQLSAVRIAGIMSVYPGDRGGHAVLLGALSRSSDPQLLEAALKGAGHGLMAPRHKRELAAAIRKRLPEGALAALSPLPAMALYRLDAGSANSQRLARVMDIHSDTPTIHSVLEAIASHGRSLVLDPAMEQAMVRALDREDLAPLIRLKTARLLSEVTRNELHYDKAARVHDKFAQKWAAQ